MAVLRLRYDLLGGTGEREPRDEAVIEHSPGLLAPAQAVERADHLRPSDATQPDDRFALRRPVVAARPQCYQHRADSLFCNLPGLGAIRPRRAGQILHDVTNDPRPAAAALSRPYGACANPLTS